MQLLIAFLVLCALGGVVMRKRSLRDNQLALFVLCCLVAIGYFYFNQI